MKGIIAVILAVAMCSLTVFAAPLPLVDGIQVGAKAAVVIEAQTGRVAFWQNADEKLPMASTTKIMTALITLEQKEIDESFVVDSNAIKVEGSSMGLKEGDMVTLRTLAAGMMLASGNDAANAAAVKVAGSVANFVEIMNERAARMGLSSTSFETPSGLDGKNHYSTAYDMAVMAKHAIANQDFAKICGSKKMVLEYGNPPYRRSLTNHNRLLFECKEAVGVKTGFTKKAGRCLVSAMKRDGVTLICVTLDAYDDWNIHQRLYNECFPMFELVSSDIPEQCLKIPVGGGTAEETEVVPSQFEGITLVKSEKDIVKKKVYMNKFVLAPVEKGRIVGKVDYCIEGIPVATQYLTTASEVPARPIVKKKSLWEKINSYFK